MASFQLSDLRASVEVVVFSRSYEQVGTKLTEGATVVIEGKIDASDGRLRLLASAVHALEELQDRPLSATLNGSKCAARSDAGGTNGNAGTSSPSFDRPPKHLTIEFQRGSDRSDDLARIVAAYEVLQRFHGQDEVEIMVRQGTRLTAIPLPNKLIGYCDQLASELIRVLEGAAVRVDGESISV